jgi:hypothetical protein
MVGGKGLFILVCTSILISGGNLVALADGPPSPSMGEVPDWVKSTGIIGGVVAGPFFAVWYAWHVTTRVIPDKEKLFTEQLTTARTVFSEQLDKMQEMHSQYIKDTNKTHADHIQLLTANYREDLSEMWRIKHEDDKAATDVQARLTEAINALGGKLVCKYAE